MTRRGRCPYGRTLLLVAGLMLAPVPALAEPTRSDRGWGYLIDKLAADGVARERALAVFNDPRVEPFTGLQFSLAPGEPRALYRGFLRPASVARARQCRREYAGAFDAAARTHGVPATLLAAIVHVESGCGQCTGSHPILPRLARLAMAMAPANLERNLERHAAGCGPGTADDVEARTRERARALEAMFYPEVLATFDLARRLGVDPLDIRGSEGGAFGMPQFLPTSYFQYGVDADGDGRVSLSDPDDAIASAANYLAGHGWRPDLSPAERRSVLWSYNHSRAYIDAVLALADRLGGAEPAPRPAVRVAHRQHPAAQTVKAKPPTRGKRHLVHSA